MIEQYSCLGYLTGYVNIHADYRVRDLEITVPYRTGTVVLGACRGTFLCDSIVSRRLHVRIHCLHNQVLDIGHVYLGIMVYPVYIQIYLKVILKYMGMAHL